MEVDFSQQIKAAEKYGGVKRTELKDSDFLIPSERKFPIMTGQDVKDAVSSFGRYKGEISYEEFKAKLVKIAKRKGLQSSLPKTIKEEFKIQANVCIPDEIKSLLASKAEKSDLCKDDLEKVFAIGIAKCDSFFRPGKTDIQLAMARVNRFIKTKDADLVEDSDCFNFSDLELSLSSIELLEKGISNIEIKAEVEMDEESIAEDKKNKTLNKPFRLPSGSKKKFGVYVKNDKGNVVVVKFGDPNMEIKRDDPERRKNYRARHGCDSAGPKWKANYWSCKMWSAKPVSKITSSECDCEEECEECEEDTEDLVEVEGAKPGLWENIRKKKKKMGKKYKPAKPGSKDYPDKEAYEKAQAEDYEWDGEEEFSQESLLTENPELSTAEEIEEEEE
jgi:hypothetical protein